MRNKITLSYLVTACEELGVEEDRLIRIFKKNNLRVARRQKEGVPTERQPCLGCGGVVIGHGNSVRCDKCYLQMEDEMAALREMGHTYKTIGDTYGVSRERVRQILNEVCPDLTGHRKELNLPIARQD